MIVLDNGWAAAVEWPARVDTARNMINAADRRGRDVALATTAPALAGESVAPLAFVSAREALEQLQQAAPRPWPADHAALEKSLAAMSIKSRIETVWISDGIDTPRRAALATRLRNMGRLSAIETSSAQPPLILFPPQRTVGDGGVNRIEFRLARAVRADGQQPAIAKNVRLADSAGNVLARATLEFAAGEAMASAGLSLPTELVNRFARFDVEGEPGAGATVLADDRWQRRPVGIVTGSAQGSAAPLLDDAYYISQALGPSADIRTGRVDDLLARPLSLMFVSSETELSEAEASAAQAWIERGGVLVRFAGPRIDGSEPFLPVKLRAGGRNLGGALSWGDPPGLGAFPDRSPFRALTVPDDIKIKTQVLAEPSPDLPDKTWAKLADGTPLVTAAQRGSGWVVLFHVTATPDWSNLPLSGLFVD
ncbi:MAG: hypothetical protein KDA41_13150, partial [Planctomycetales bacterium]|nr:hypothetical protein [Planctomycetales bacterium]